MFRWIHASISLANGFYTAAPGLLRHAKQVRAIRKLLRPQTCACSEAVMDEAGDEEKHMCSMLLTMVLENGVAIWIAPQVAPCCASLHAISCGSP